MAANAALIPEKAHGWTAGLRNLLKRGLADWWKTRRWITNSLVWMAIINGILLLVLNSPGSSSKAGGSSEMEAAIQLFCIFSGLFCPIGVMIATQGTIVGEKQNGTAAWVLSKPVSRTAFILSKLLVDTLGFLVTMIIVQGLAAYFIITGHGMSLNFEAFLAGMGMLYLNLFFWQSFALMLGTIFNSRRSVIGISMIMIFLFNQLAQMNIGMILPGHLPYDAAVVIASQPLENWIPLLGAAFLSIVFIALAFWRFSREEL
jgi:ABC-2 type transport system permease protein